MSTACAPRAQPILDKRAQLERWTWWDNRDWDWYERHIPFFESPDPAIDATYYYRWEVVTKHLTYGSPETGYTFTEFIDRPFWSGAYGAISCPLGHQLYEVRWLKNREIVEDFARYWFETPGAEPRGYSNWYGDAMWATYLVLGDTAFLRTVLPHMEAQYGGWVAERYDSAHAMFSWDGLHDGMEVNINSRLTDDEQTGAEGYRPTLNSYMYADALAISKAAALLGDSAKAKDYGARAERLKQRVQEELWDLRREFFLHQFAHDEKGGIEALSLTYETGPHAGSPQGREAIGFIPWQFSLPDPGYEVAWQFLMDSTSFAAPYGPTTVEQRDPQFFVSPRCCVWSGNSWPYATSQTLEALANLLNEYDQTVVDGDDYFALFRTYASTHRKAGRPYVAEAADPYTGSWEGHDTFYHSEHYFHSQFVNLLITGLAGLRPRADDSLEVNPLVPDTWPYFALDDVPYKGHRVAIVWDADGTRYGRGSGLSLFADGRRIAHSDLLRRIVAPLGGSIQRPAPSVQRTRNLAVNNGRGPYPWVFASHSAPEAPTFYLMDGNYWYHESPPNRWTSAGSPNAVDTLVLDFGVERPVEVVKLYFLDDSAGAGPPEAYQVEVWANGSWVMPAHRRDPPGPPGGRRANVVSFLDRIQTERLRFLLTHRPGAPTGLTEIEAWAAADLPLAEPTTPSWNLADGARASASFTSQFDRIEQISDQRIFFQRYSRNRWTAFGSPNASDWIELAFGEPRTVRLVELYLWADGRGVTMPRSYTVQYWNGSRWADALVEHRSPAAPTPWAVNTVRITPVATERLRVVFEHAAPGRTGVTELIVRGDDGRP